MSPIPTAAVLSATESGWLAEAGAAAAVARERLARDKGDWQTMARAFHADSRVRLAWFDGTGRDFVEASRHRPGFVRHRLSPSVVRTSGSRAVAETPVLVESRAAHAGVEVDLIVATRYVNRLVLVEDRWLIVSVDCICERDEMRSVDPGQRLSLDDGLLASLRPSYRFLALHARSAGGHVPDDLPGDDLPDTTRPIYDAADAWLRQS